MAHACFGLEVDKAGVVIDAAPIAKWTLGKSVRDVADYYHKKGGEILVQHRGEWRPVKGDHAAPAEELKALAEVPRTRMTRDVDELHVRARVLQPESAWTYDDRFGGLCALVGIPWREQLNIYDQVMGVGETSGCATTYATSKYGTPTLIEISKCPEDESCVAIGYKKPVFAASPR